MRYVSQSKLFLLMGILMFSQASCSSETGQIHKGSVVKIQYAMDVNGVHLVAPPNLEEMHLVVGESKYPPDFEKALIGMKVGSEKVITLKPEQAFGPVRPELFKRIPKSQFPGNIVLKQGALLHGTNDDGNSITMRVVQILDDSVVVDQNHPLAGKTLVYRIRIKEVG